MSSYATIADADTYFVGRLYSTVWNAASNLDKTNSLAQATRIIDRLSFAGERHAASEVRLALTGTRDFEISLTQAHKDAIRAAALTQELEFPRGKDTVIPDDVKIASYEIAYALLDGVDPDLEYQDQGVVSQGHSSVRTTYDRSAVQEHTNSGIPSPVAWRYLKPYLRESHGVKISRV